MTFAIPQSWAKYLLLALTAMFFTSCATGSQASREHKVQRKDSAEENACGNRWLITPVCI